MSVSHVQSDVRRCYDAVQRASVDPIGHQRFHLDISSSENERAGLGACHQANAASVHVACQSEVHDN